MNLYLICFRLSLPLFFLASLAEIVVFQGTSFVFSLITAVVIFPIGYFGQYPFIKRYNYFFFNQGWTRMRLFAVTGSIYIMIFLAIMMILKLTD